MWVSLGQRRGAILTAFMFILTVSPWVIRNSLLHHKLTGIETSMGYNLYLGYHPQGDGSFVFGPSLDLLTILDDAKRDRIGTEKAIEFIKAQPERFVPLAVNRLGFFFGLEKRVLMYFYSNNIVGYIPRSMLLTISAILLLPFVIISISGALGLAYLTGSLNIFCFAYYSLVTYCHMYSFCLKIVSISRSYRILPSSPRNSGSMASVPHLLVGINPWQEKLLYPLLYSRCFSCSSTGVRNFRGTRPKYRSFLGQLATNRTSLIDHGLR